MLDTPENMLASSRILFTPAEVHQAIFSLANQLTEAFSDQKPLVLAVMGGAVVFAGQLLPLLHFPLEFDYVHVSRYGHRTEGGELNWFRALTAEQMRGRVVLVLDDILDEGETMAAIRTQVLAAGARAFYSAVFVNKQIAKSKPLYADFVGLQAPDVFVFGYGMDVAGWWRNLPAIYVLNRQ